MGEIERLLRGRPSYTRFAQIDIGEACQNRDGVRDIVELEIEKHVEAAIDHPPNGLGARDDKELLADFERARRGIEPIRERERMNRIGEVERDDDFGIRHYAYPSGVSVRRGE